MGAVNGAGVECHQVDVSCATFDAAERIEFGAAEVVVPGEVLDDGGGGLFEEDDSNVLRSDFFLAFGEVAGSGFASGGGLDGTRNFQVEVGGDLAGVAAVKPAVRVCGAVAGGAEADAPIDGEDSGSL